MKRDTKDAIATPVVLLLVIGFAYGIIKLIKSLPVGSSDETVFAGVLIMVFIGVPLFFLTLMAIVALAIWASTEDKQ